MGVEALSEVEWIPNPARIDDVEEGGVVDRLFAFRFELEVCRSIDL